MKDLINIQYKFLEDDKCYAQLYWYDIPDIVYNTEIYSSFEEAKKRKNFLINKMIPEYNYIKENYEDQMMSIRDLIDMQITFLHDGNYYAQLFWYKMPDMKYYTKTHSTIEYLMNEINVVINKMITEYNYYKEKKQ